MGKLKVEKMVLGAVRTNTWFAVNDETKELIMIDPADLSLIHISEPTRH